MTVRFHVDDMMSSHKEKSVNDKFLLWLNKKYGDLGEVTCTRGPVHNCLGMMFWFGNQEVQVDMREYVSEMLAEFPVKFNNNGRVMTPEGDDLFKANSSKLLPEKERELFHRTVAKALFLCKRGRPDIQTVVAVLCSSVRTPGRQERMKLVRMMKFLH